MRGVSLCYSTVSSSSRGNSSCSPEPISSPENGPFSPPAKRLKQTDSANRGAPPNTALTTPAPRGGPLKTPLSTPYRLFESDSASKALRRAIWQRLFDPQRSVARRAGKILMNHFFGPGVRILGKRGWNPDNYPVGYFDVLNRPLFVADGIFRNCLAFAHVLAKRHDVFGELVNELFPFSPVKLPRTSKTGNSGLKQARHLAPVETEERPEHMRKHMPPGWGMEQYFARLQLFFALLERLENAAQPPTVKGFVSLVVSSDVHEVADFWKKACSARTIGGVRSGVLGQDTAGSYGLGTLCDRCAESDRSLFNGLTAFARAFPHSFRDAEDSRLVFNLRVVSLQIKFLLYRTLCNKAVLWVAMGRDCGLSHDGATPREGTREGVGHYKRGEVVGQGGEAIHKVPSRKTSFSRTNLFECDF